jgi:hypothetical protein
VEGGIVLKGHRLEIEEDRRSEPDARMPVARGRDGRGALRAQAARAERTLADLPRQRPDTADDAIESATTTTAM